MWILYAFGSALFAGLTAILAKIGVRHSPANLVTALRTVVVLVFAWLVVFLVGSQATLATLDGRTLLFLVLSGLATGASWLCYFKALQLGDVNQVTPIDKSSIVLTVGFAILFLGETDNLAYRLVGIVVIAAGTYLMIQRTPSASVPAAQPGTAAQPTPAGRTRLGWLAYAVASAVFAALTSILGKVGITGVESNLGTAIRTVVVLVMAWVVVLVTGEQRRLREIPRRDLVFIGLSGVATGASWLFFYRALQEGPASVVVPIDKLSIVVTVAFASLVLRERLTARAGVGLALIVAGTLVMLL
nr:EamA family transporter [Propionibacterium sp.]